MGVNSHVQLAEAERIVQGRLRHSFLENGVTMLLPETIYLAMDTQIGSDTILYPGVILEGQTSIGSNCVLGPNTHIIDFTVGDECRIISSMLESSVVDRGVSVGPYSHLRPGTHLGEGVHIGNYVEVKNSTLASGVHSGHFSYLGDATIGEDTNIGAGTITANYDRATRANTHYHRPRCLHRRRHNDSSPARNRRWGRNRRGQRRHQRRPALLPRSGYTRPG